MVPSPATEGILYVTSRPKEVTSSTLNKWYIQEHIPDVLKTTGIPSTFRYTNATQSTIFKSPPSSEGKEKEEFLSLYPVKKLKWLDSEEYLSIPVKSEILGEGKGEKLCYDVVDFGVRFYRWVGGFEGERASGHPAPAKLSITAGMSPPVSKEDDFNAWYDQEHYASLAACKHYIRTRRYRIERTVAPESDPAPTFLTIHEFDCEPEELDAEGLGKAGATDWSQRVLKELVKNETSVWRLMGGGWGEKEVRF